MNHRNTILVINSGSSSIKYSLFEGKSFKLILKDTIEDIGSLSSVKNHHQGIEKVFSDIEKNGVNTGNIAGVGHRVVHGGERFTEPVIINKRVINAIRKNIKLAPLHNPANLEGITACRKFLSKVKQVAVFDTSFHQTIPPYVYLYGLPYKFYKKDRVRRYGFHGTSHQYVALEAAKKLKRPLNKLKLITVHLGNGCSISAVDKGKSIDTSMGFTPLEGLIMGTRSGDLDPAIIFYLERHNNLKIEEIDELLNKKSGLLGVSGVDNDMRKVKKAAPKNKKAKLAVEMFIYKIKKYIGSYVAALDGCDSVVFTAGIGENNPDLVKKSTQGLGKFLKKKPKVLIIPTNEELMIAKLTYDKINAS